MYELKKDILNYIEFKIKPFYHSDAKYGKHKINYVITKTKEHDCIDFLVFKEFILPPTHLRIDANGNLCELENFQYSICYEEGNIKKKLQEKQRMKKYNQKVAHILIQKGLAHESDEWIGKYLNPVND